MPHMASFLIKVISKLSQTVNEGRKRKKYIWFANFYVLESNFDKFLIPTAEFQDQQ